MTYGYDSRGFRTSALHEIDSEGNGSFESSTSTEYLADAESMTGYTQTILETHRDHEQAITKEIEYTFGLDEIAQTVTIGSNSSTEVFGHDGHGSVRMLTDVNELIAEAYLYDAYGQMLAIFNSAGSVASGAAPTGGNPRTFADASQALTNLLYSGETFDPRLGQQYLRARWYDPATGRFNRLDPFFGDRYDPQSLHKYLYVHGDPANGIDPRGLWSIASLVSGLSFGASLAAGNATAAFAAAPEFYTFAIILPFVYDFVGNFGTVLDRNASTYSRATALAFIAFDVLPVGRILKRIAPTRSVQRMIGWTKAILDEHSKNAPATRRAMAAAFLFSEDVVESSVVVKGAGGAGADIVGITRTGRTIGREVSVYQGNLKGIYGKIIGEANQIEEHIDIKHVFIQVTDDFLTQPGSKERIADAAAGAERDYLRDFSERIIVTIVDGGANQLYPLMP